LGRYRAGNLGPYDTENERDSKVRALKREHGDDHGIFKLTVKNNIPEVEAYSGGFLRRNEP